MARPRKDMDPLASDPTPFPLGGHHIEYIKVDEKRPEGDSATCLRPLGLCELGGSCDSCWYRPDHPRFRDR